MSTIRKLMIATTLLALSAASHGDELNVNPDCEVVASASAPQLDMTGMTLDNSIDNEPLEASAPNWEAEHAIASRERDFANLEQLALKSGMSDAEYRLKATLINARFYVTDAAIAQLSKNHPRQAQSGLDNSKHLLDSIAKGGNPTEMKNIKTVSALLGKTEKLVIACHGQSKWQEGHAYENLEAALQKIIRMQPAATAQKGPAKKGTTQH